MESLKELYRIGTGPSSSHTMGPERAAHRFKEKYPQADRFFVTLYGSLAKTGKGHLTDDILVKTFAPLPVEIRFDLSDKPLPHPNTLELTAIENDKEIGFERVMSVGGGKRAKRKTPPQTFTRFPHSPTSKLTAPRVTCAFGSMRKSARARRFGTI